VALKILPADLASNQDRMRRFVQEAQAAAALNHPNIAHIYEIGEADGLHFIAMEFVQGADLEHLLKHKAPLTLAAVKEATRRATRAAALRDAEDILLSCYLSEDFKEGVRAFLEKRKADWQGR